MKELYDKKAIAYYSHTRTELLPFIPATVKNVLDVGCAAGNFGEMLKALFHCEVWGIEPDANAAQLASKKLDRVFHAPFDQQIDLPIDKKFDCIFFNDVLEHLAQPDEALQLAAKYLAPNGCVIASIPNLRFYPAMLSLIRHQDFQYLDAGVMDKTHLRFFTRKSMIRLFEESGYRVQQIEGINRHTFKYLEVLNFFTFKSVDDMHYPQYAIVATKNDE